MPYVKGVRAVGDSDITLGKDKVISTYSLEYVVIADNMSQGPVVIRLTSGLPLVGLDTYTYGGETDLTAICKRKRCKRDAKQWSVWYVTCEFDNDPSSQSQQDETTQPAATARPIMLEWDSEYGERVLYKDFSTPPKSCVSSNGERFDPPLTTPVVYPVLSATRYQTTFSVATKLQYENKVNSVAWNGAAAYSVLCTSIRASQVVEDGAKLWRVTYRFRYNPLPDGYLTQPLNQGTYKLVPVSGAPPNRVPFVNNGVPYVANLSGNGQAEVQFGAETYGGPSAFITGGTGTSTTAVTPGYKTFEAVAFAGLGLTF
jgi:hypothetical protein